MFADGATQHFLEDLLRPRSVAVVGASQSKNAPGALLLSSLIEFGFPGSIYPVNRQGDTLQGLKAYTSLSDIPGPVDMVILATPANTTLDVMGECIAKRVKLVTVFTAGYRETGLFDRSQLEKKLVAEARANGVRILGPNCMGIYNPQARVTFAMDFPRNGGSIGLISQSGGNAHSIVREGAVRGGRFSKVISYGNASDLDESDLLEYFSQDSQTNVVLCYIEGVKNGTRFMSMLKKAASAKTVIVLKGGDTEAGGRGAMSHTASLAGSSQVWRDMLKQMGANQVQSIEEVIDSALLHAGMKKPTGRNTGLVGIGGGASVLAADACSRAGLNLPDLPPEIRERLQSSIPVAGNMISNPADFTTVFWDSPTLRDAIHIIGSWQGIELLILHASVNIGPRALSARILEPLADAFIDGARLCQKPTAIVVHGTYYADDYALALRMMEKCQSAGLPVFRSVGNAATAISRFIGY